MIITDDESFNIMAIKGLFRVLRMQDMDRVDVCYNGEDTCRLIRKAIDEGDIDRYNLILTDCSMPFMDGYESSKRIRRMRWEAKNPNGRVDFSPIELADMDRELTIAAITGHIEPSYIKKAKDHGINQVFGKPMTVKKLGQLLKDHGFIEEIPSMDQSSDSE